jgi:hypothetical protein
MDNTPLDQQTNEEDNNIPLDGPIDQGEQEGTRPGNNEEMYLVTGKTDISIGEAKHASIQDNMKEIDRLIESAYGLDAPLEDVAGTFEYAKVKTQDFMENPDYFLEQAIALGDPEVSPTDMRAAVNQQIGWEMIQELSNQEKAEGGVVDAVLDFGAFAVREATIGAVEAWTDRTERRGTELLWHQLNDSPSEFKAWFQTWIDDAAKEGRNMSSWSISQLEEEFFSAGFDKSSNVKKAFALLDILAPLIPYQSLLKLPRSLAGTTTRIGRVAAVRGAEDAAEVAVEATTKRIDPETATVAGPGTLNPHPQPVPVSEGWYARALARDGLLKRVDDLYRSGSAGRALTPEEMDSAIAKASDNFEARVGSPIVSTVPKTLELGRHALDISIGKTDGSVFKPMADGSAPQGVKELAAKIGGEVTQVNPNNVKEGYVATVRENLAVRNSIDAIDPGELERMERGIVRNTFGRAFGNRVMASAPTRDVDELNIAVQLGEGFSAAVKREFTQEAKKISKIGGDDVGYINTIIGKLRDDPVEATRRSWYTPEDFAIKYEELAGKAPTQKVRDAYQAAVDISDTAAALKAVRIMDNYLDKGYKTIDLGDIQVPAKPYGKTPEADDLIYDAELGQTFRFKNLYEDFGTVYKLDKPQFDGVEYAVKPKAVKELDPTDVMGYNAGGQRLNPNANYFVTVGVGNRMKALLTAFTEADVKLAAKQLDELRVKYLNQTLTDEDVARLNSWNREITTVEELAEHMRLYGWKFTDDVPIRVKERDEEILDVAIDEASYGMRADEYISNDLRRNDRVLPEFGGGKSYNIDPLTAIGQQFNNAATEFSFRHYTDRAIIGWVKEAQRRGVSWFPKGVAPDDYRTLFKEAKVSGNGDFPRRMREIRATNMRRMHMKSEAAKSMENLGQQMSEYVFQTGKLGKSVAPSLRGNLAGRIIDKMLTIGMHSAFGFMNTGQVFIQGSHATTIAAISPRFGPKAATMALLSRPFSHEGPEVIQEFAKRMSGMSGYKWSEIDEMMEYLRTSGRDVVDGDAIEAGTGVGYGISGFGGESYMPSTLRKSWEQTKKVGNIGLEAGLMPFNFGERLSRRTAIFTAIMEFKAKNPGVALNSDAARKWITRREQDLTFNMTTSSRPLAQSGVMKPMTQWMSHTFRSMEQVFVGRNFTKGERWRMAAVLFPMYGLSGFGAANAASYIWDKFGWSEDSAWYTGVKWGVYDGLTDWLIPDTVGKQGTGLAPRLAPAGAVLETYRKITEGSFAEVIGGPSGGIVYNTLDAVAGALGNLIHGRDVALTEDIIKIIRQPTGSDNLFKAYGIFQNSVYRSKNGTTIPGEMTATDGIMQLLGITTLKQTEWYNMKTKVFRENRKFQRDRKDYERDAEVAFAIMQNPETYERGLEMIDELHAKITLSGYSYQQQTQLRKTISTLAGDQWLTIQRQLWDMERITDEQMLGKVLGKYE